MKEKIPELINEKNEIQIMARTNTIKGRRIFFVFTIVAINKIKTDNSDTNLIMRGESPNNSRVPPANSIMIKEPQKATFADLCCLMNHITTGNNEMTQKINDLL